MPGPAWLPLLALVLLPALVRSSLTPALRPTRPTPALPSLRGAADSVDPTSTEGGTLHINFTRSSRAQYRRRRESLEAREAAARHATIEANGAWANYFLAGFGTNGG